MDTPKSTISGSTNVDHHGEDESPLVEEFLNGVQYYEEADIKRKHESTQPKCLLEFFTAYAPNELCPHALTDICNNALFEFCYQELLVSLQDDIFEFAESGISLEQHLLENLRICSFFHYMGSKLSKFLSNFYRTLRSIAARYAHIMHPILPNNADQSDANVTSLKIKIILQFMKQSLGIMADTAIGSNVFNSRVISFLQAKMLESPSPVHLLLLVLVCITDSEDQDEPFSGVNSKVDVGNCDYDNPKSPTDDTFREIPSTYSENMRMIQCNQLDIAQGYILQFALAMCSVFPTSIADLTISTDRRNADQSHAKDSINELKSLLLEYFVNLQVVLSVLANVGFLKESTPGYSEDILLAKLSNNSLPVLVDNLTPFLPMMCMSIRVALLYICLGTRYDLVLTILKQSAVVPMPSASLLASISSTGDAIDCPIEPESIVRHSSQPVGDNDLIHFHRMTRLEAIQMLSSKPIGAFIVRPHDSQPDMLYLSFKSTAEEGVKHAVIRKDLIKSNSSSTSTSSIPGSTRESLQYEYRCGKVGPCKSLEDILRAINQAIPSGLKFNIIITKRELQANGIVLQHDSSSPRNTRLPSGNSLNNQGNTADMDAAKTATSTINASDASPASTSSRLRLSHLIDINHDLWVCIFTQLKALGNAIARSEDNHQMTDQWDNSNGNGYGNQDISLLERDDVASVDDLLWHQFPRSFRAATLLEGVLFLLAVKSLHKQIISQRDSIVLHIISALTSRRQKLLSSDEASINMESAWSTSSGYDYLCSMMIRVFGNRLMRCDLPVSISSLLPATGTGCTSINGTSLQDKELAQIMLDSTTVVDGFIALIQSFLVASEQLLLSGLVPPAPLTIPILPDHCVTGLLEGEELVKHMMFAIPMKAVKFTGKGSGNGTDHALVCFESSELMNFFTAAISGFRGPSSLSKPAKRLYNLLVDDHQNSNNISADSSLPSVLSTHRRVQMLRLFRNLELIAANALTAVSKKVAELGASGAASAVLADESAVANKLLQEVSALIIIAVTPFVRELFYGRAKPATKSLIVPPHESNALPTRSTDTATPAGINDRSGNRVGDAENAKRKTIPIVSPDENNSEKFVFENAAEYILWLLEVGLLRSIVKTPDSSSSHPSQLFYCYSDPWEVKSMTDLPNPGDISKLGRHRFQLVSPYCGSAALELLCSVYGTASQNAIQDGTPRKRGARKPTMSDAISAAIRTTLATEIEDSGNTISVNMGQDLRKLWESLRSELWLVSVFGSSYEHADREFGGKQLPIPSPYGDSHMGRGAHMLTAYESCISRYLYRNSLFWRVGLPHRFVSSIQVDIFGIREVPSAHPQGFSFPSSLSASMDVFAIVRLIRGSNGGSNVSCPTTGGIMSGADMGGAGGGNSTSSTGNANSGNAAINGLTALVSGVTGSGANVFGTPKLLWNGSHQTQPKRVEASRVPSSATAGTEYNWKDQATFKFSLAEGLVSLRRNNVHHDLEGPFFAPPNSLVVTVYEKSFFGDSKVGEVELSLASLTDERSMRDWVPLISDKSGTWLVHLQVLQKYSLLALDLPQHLVTNN